MKHEKQCNSDSKSEKQQVESYLERWIRQMNEVKHLLIPVTMNIALTLAIWCGVYGMKPDPNSVFYYMLDPGHNVTTGNGLLDGMLNGFGCVLMLGLISFVLLAMALKDYKRLIQCWLCLSCILIIFGVFASFLLDVCKAMEWDWLLGWPIFFLVIIYGGVGLLVFFTRKMPLFMHQFYVICNCSLISVFYLRMFPTHTAWFVLFYIILWDAFAVLNPIGPLRRIHEKAHDYSDQVLGLLMFTARDSAKSKTEAESELETSYKTENYDGSESESDTNTAELIERKKPLERGKKTVKTAPKEISAYDALNDGSSLRLGMGDFVFYSLLVGKAASMGSVLSTLGAITGIVVGLQMTLTVISNEEETTPALPVSIAIGSFLHFSIYFIIEPLLYSMLSYAMSPF